MKINDCFSNVCLNLRNDKHEMNGFMLAIIMKYFKIENLTVQNNHNGRGFAGFVDDLKPNAHAVKSFSYF